ncbi:hypothetical protein PIB30_098997 [Stylosanthes scabra]|uniref:non-specific serine/threonine protein kinase n=1 Tax=Stylosanthes scabra TaxID=79078 RepID=A0ABU6SWZ6_9FABA|nr:hypothetical protein [Stylosanthes scabra]
MEAKELNWSKRVKIIKGTAFALAYMHRHCTPPIVHRNVTTSNILLNSELDACVSDFGTARLLHTDSSNHTVLMDILLQKIEENKARKQRKKKNREKRKLGSKLQKITLEKNQSQVWAKSQTYPNVTLKKAREPNVAT